MLSSRFSRLSASPLKAALTSSTRSGANRSIHASIFRPKDQPKSRTAADDECSHARTDPSITMKHPEENKLPTSKAVEGWAGGHVKLTLPTFSLQGGVVLVTGGARGLGLVMAQAVLISGADVAIVDMDKEQATKSAEELVKTFQKDNPAERIPKVTAHYADVSSEESVGASILEIIKKHGKIDHLVTSAGFTENVEAINYPLDRVRKLWGVNVDGTWLFATGVARHLMERKAKGSMVFIGSMSGSIVNVPQPQAPYNASKAAVRHLASSLAIEWATSGIRVNCISPGYMLTALTKVMLKEKPELQKQWTSLIPQGVMGAPEDLMGAVTFLLSDASGYVTGADLRVDGGYTLT